jgi:hypothetical protein
MTTHIRPDRVYRLCTDCHWFNKPTGGRLGDRSATCLRTAVVDLDDGLLCKDERRSSLPDSCGLEAKFFRAKGT